MTVLTCFTGNVAAPSGFALACQLDKGLSADVDYMALRRAEDRRACAVIGAEAVHWPFLEAPHRGYADAAALFAGLRADDHVVDALMRALMRLCAENEADVVYGPFGVGNHVDHIVLRRALENTGFADKVRWWEDYPYAMREPAPPAGIARHKLDPESAARKLAASMCYESQLGFQFGGARAVEAALRDWQVEGLTTAL